MGGERYVVWGVLIAAGSLLSLFWLYIGARLVSRAFFRTLKEERKDQL